MQRLIDSLRQAVPDGLEEIQTLAKTLISRSQDILAYFDHPRTSNGPTPGDQRAPGAPTRHRPGLPQPGQLHHQQPHPHRTPQRPPDKQPPKPADKPHLPHPQTRRAHKPLTRSRTPYAVFKVIGSSFQTNLNGIRCRCSVMKAPLVKALQAHKVVEL